MEGRLYKDKYLIALYDKDDFLFMVASNVSELARLTNKKYDCIQSTLSHRIDKLIVDGVWQLKDSKPTSHDICSSLNNIRIRLNRGCSLGLVDRIILLSNGCFKIAKDKFEAEWYLKKDYRVGIKHLVRYYENMKVLKRNGQGQLLDPSGNPIDEEDANAMFRTIFAIGNNEAV